MPLPKLALRILRWGLIAGGAGALAVIAVNACMVGWARAKTAQSVNALAENEVGIVLGTSPRSGQWRNPFFENRMDAAAELYRAGRVRHLLVSGDNHRHGYDEPTEMRNALVRRGVPASAVTLDYAGFRTLDTMARARSVFGLKKATVITDDFHQPRALFLASAFGLEAVGYPSARVPFKWSKKTLAREVASRVWACLDVYVLRTKPKFYGPKVKIAVQ